MIRVGGQEKFNSLSNKKNKIFEQHSLKYNLKKHIEKNIWGMLLPVPEERELLINWTTLIKDTFL